MDSHEASGRSDDNDSSDVVETDPEGRYYRYKETVGKGRFKEVYKAFNSQIGIDVAWSKVSAGPNHLDQNTLDLVAEEMRRGLDLDHPNIIRCFKCWEDPSNGCINLITELFTSGNLRQYRNMHKHLDLKAVKRMAKQILKGLGYLHSQNVTHGDLRCDKIYVNGHSGEIKIGDLGLATLQPFRWEEGQQNRLAFNASGDVFAFGLCMLELITLHQLDPQHCVDYSGVLDEVPDEEARAFIEKCLGPEEQRPNAEQLLNDTFLALRKVEKPPLGEDRGGMAGSSSQADLQGRGGMGSEGPGGLMGTGSRSGHHQHDGSTHGGLGQPGSGPPEASIAVGRLKGEDYEFVFTARHCGEGKLRFQLTMLSVQRNEGSQPKLDIEFDFDYQTDTADALASELSEQFKLSPTDTEICAAALKEYLARELQVSEER